MELKEYNEKLNITDALNSDDDSFYSSVNDIIPRNDNPSVNDIIPKNDNPTGTLNDMKRDIYRNSIKNNKKNYYCPNRKTFNYVQKAAHDAAERNMDKADKKRKKLKRKNLNFTQKEKLQAKKEFQNEIKKTLYNEALEAVGLKKKNRPDSGTVRLGEPTKKSAIMINNIIQKYEKHLNEANQKERVRYLLEEEHSREHERESLWWNVEDINERYLLDQLFSYERDKAAHKIYRIINDVSQNLNQLNIQNSSQNNSNINNQQSVQLQSQLKPPPQFLTHDDINYKEIVQQFKKEKRAKSANSKKRSENNATVNVSTPSIVNDSTNKNDILPTLNDTNRPDSTPSVLSTAKERIKLLPSAVSPTPTIPSPIQVIKKFTSSSLINNNNIKNTNVIDNINIKKIIKKRRKNHHKRLKALSKQTNSEIGTSFYNFNDVHEIYKDLNINNQKLTSKNKEKQKKIKIKNDIINNKISNKLKEQNYRSVLRKKKMKQRWSHKQKMKKIYDDMYGIGKHNYSDANVNMNDYIKDIDYNSQDSDYSNNENKDIDEDELFRIEQEKNAPPPSSIFWGQASNNKIRQQTSDDESDDESNNVDMFFQNLKNKHNNKRIKLHNGDYVYINTNPKLMNKEIIENSNTIHTNYNLSNIGINNEDYYNTVKYTTNIGSVFWGEEKKDRSDSNEDVKNDKNTEEGEGEVEKKKDNIVILEEEHHQKKKTLDHDEQPPKEENKKKDTIDNNEMWPERMMYNDAINIRDNEYGVVTIYSGTDLTSTNLEIVLDKNLTTNNNNNQIQNMSNIEEYNDPRGIRIHIYIPSSGTQWTTSLTECETCLLLNGGERKEWLRPDEVHSNSKYMKEYWKNIFNPLINRLKIIKLDTRNNVKFLIDRCIYSSACCIGIEDTNTNHQNEPKLFVGHAKQMRLLIKIYIFPTKPEEIDIDNDDNYNIKWNNNNTHKKKNNAVLYILLVMIQEITLNLLVKLQHQKPHHI